MPLPGDPHSIPDATQEEIGEPEHGHLAPCAADSEEHHLKARPDVGTQWFRLAFISARIGAADAARSALRRSVAVGGGDRARSKLRIDLTLGDYEAVERDARPLLASSAPKEWADGLNLLLLAFATRDACATRSSSIRRAGSPDFPRFPRARTISTRHLNLERGDAWVQRPCSTQWRPNVATVVIGFSGAASDVEHDARSDGARGRGRYRYGSGIDR